jgi:hypothetical protein
MEKGDREKRTKKNKKKLREMEFKNKNMKQ